MATGTEIEEYDAYGPKWLGTGQAFEIWHIFRIKYYYKKFASNF